MKYSIITTVEVDVPYEAMLEELDDSIIDIIYGNVDSDVDSVRREFLNSNERTVKLKLVEMYLEKLRKEFES